MQIPRNPAHRRHRFW